MSHRKRLVIVAAALVATTVAAYGPSRGEGASVNDNPHAIGDDGFPVIFQVMASRDLEAVKRLVDAGADIEAKGVGGATPVLISALAQSWHICRYLLERGADPTVVMSTGLTVPYLAKSAQIDPNTKLGRDLAAVRKILSDRGLDRLALPPREVKNLITLKRWPPRKSE